jgi:N-acetylglutamate synthase-like GNAT family acetyltransferase
MTLQIRRVTLCDVPEIAPLIAQMGYPISEEELTARVALYQLGQNNIAWVALNEESIVGCVALHIYDLFHCAERYSRIVSLVVKDTYRRAGIGKKLIEHAEKYAINHNCSTLELSSSLKRLKTGTHAFYDALGYKNEGETESRYLRKFLRPKVGPYL